MAEGCQDESSAPEARGGGATLFTHMLAESCCWELGTLTMAVECPGEAGAG